jgi:di/tricarboxylate transporter
MEIWIVSIIITIAVFFIITEKMSVDLTAMGIMVSLMVTGILTPTEAVAGFANPAVITVGAMFLISRAMMRTGLVAVIGQRVIDLTRGNAGLATVVVLVIVSLASAFLNNTPVVVLFIPVMISLGCRFGISPSKVLIPISYASILAGTCTLIGTSTNIIVSDLSVSYGFGEIGMFELAKVGLPIAVAGLLLIIFLGPRLMPDVLNSTCELSGGTGRRYLAEIAIPRGSPLVGMSPCSDLAADYPGLEVIELIRYSHIFHPCRDEVRIAPGDLLLIKGSPSTLLDFLDQKGVELPPSEKKLTLNGPDETILLELIITPTSALIGRPLRETDLLRNGDRHVIAVERSGLHYTEKQIRDIRLKIGDILLVLCRADRIDQLRGRTDWIIAEDVHHDIVHKRKAPLTALIFIAMVVSAATGLANIMLAALAAVFLLMVTGCLPLNEAYRALQGNVLLLIAGTIALGLAMDKSGASQLYADAFIHLLKGAPVQVTLGGFVLLTSISTQILSNNATAVLLMPIAISAAAGLGVHPKPFIMAVVFGASACFATPIGYQTNLLVYGPGGYRFSDYLKLGIPMNLLVVVMATLLVPLIWPFVPN